MAHTVAVQTTAAAPLSQLKITTTTRPDQVQSFNPVRRDCGCPAGAFAYPAAASLTTPHHTVKLQFSLIHHIITSLILFSLKLIADHFILLLSLYHFNDGIWLWVIAHLIPNFEATVAKTKISYVRPTVSQLFLIVLQFPTTVFPSVAIA